MGPIRHRLFLSILRNRTAAALAAKKGITLDDARVMVDTLDDSTILAAAEAHEVPATSIGNGAIIAWLVAHGPQILQVVEFLVGLLMTFGTTPPK